MKMDEEQQAVAAASPAAAAAAGCCCWQGPTAGVQEQSIAARKWCESSVTFASSNADLGQGRKGGTHCRGWSSPPLQGLGITCVILACVVC